MLVRHSIKSSVKEAALNTKNPIFSLGIGIGGVIIVGVSLAAAPPPSKNPSSVLTQPQFSTSRELERCAIGNAEGTKTDDCKPTKYYYGHSDPGNGVRNFGYCSNQSRTNSAKGADASCDRYLDQWKPRIKQELKAAGIENDREAYLNTLDLSNQANPKHFPHLPKLIQEQRKRFGDTDEAIAWARVEAFFVPGTPYPSGLCKGSLRHNVAACKQRVFKDQLRRVKEIDKINQKF